MGLIDMIKKSKLGFGGENPTYKADNTKLSTLHNRYSTDGTPDMKGYPPPSTLDLTGKKIVKYLDNPPK